jgi:fructokinase
MAGDDMILVGGEALYDLVVDESGGVHAHAGGGPFNTARTLGRLERPVAYLGRLSTDRFGTTLERMLADDGVRLDAMTHTEEPTTLALAEIDASGSASYRFYLRATSAPGLTPEAALAALPASVGILHVGTLGLTLEPIATALEAVVSELAGRALVAVDPNIRSGVITDPGPFRARLGRVLADTDLLKVSEDDLAWLDGGRSATDAARTLLDAGPTVALVTRGADGATVVTADAAIAIPAPAVDVVDTIGAGDAFGGGFLAWWQERGLGAEALGDADLVVQATEFACLVAALTCARAGASPPRLDELRASGGFRA